MRSREQGFVKTLLFGIIAIFLLLIVLAVASRYIGGGLSGTGTSLSNLSSNDYSYRANPLLPNLPDYDGSSTGGSSSGSSGGSTGSSQPGRSPYAAQIDLWTGNAGSTAQPYEEHVTIRNTGNPVSITGWTLTNGKGTRPIETSHNSYVYPTTDSAVIGQGTQFLDPSGNFVIGDIVLGAGDNAIITTGQPFSQFPFSIYTSFRENKCAGYLENYPFTPPMSTSLCPAAAQEEGTRNVTEQCYDYLLYVNRCSNPEKTDKKRFDETLTSQCKAFIREHLNYPGCVSYHRSDSDFSLKQWRVFLGKNRELWASRRETITLYDKQGLIVDQVSY
ncbi:MAG: hypothetical protein HZA81_03955 [Candidatus Taylorbacteria bacterium]|nr:hypothetical protein [Candidatus Taylorbacteria bacterium]